MSVLELKAEKSEEVSSVFHSIVAATDFSEASGRALRVAMRFAEHHKARLSVVHVAQTDWRYEMLDQRPEMKMEEADVEQRLRTAVEQLHLSGKIDSILTKQGPVVDGVLSTLDHGRADLLTIGTRGRAGLQKIALGSVAEELLRLAECPVLTIGPKAEIASGSELRTILFATDFGTGSTKLLPQILSLSKKERAKLIVLHTIPPMPVTSTSLCAYSPGIAAADELRDWEECSRKRSLGKLHQWVAPYLGPGDFEPEYLVGTEFLAEAMLNAADRWKAGLIAMGANRSASPRWTAHFPWTAVHKIIHHAPCPVMTMAA